MKWAPEDIDVFLDIREYVDSVIIALLPVTFDQEMRQASSMSEFINLLTGQLEKQFRGRLLNLPGITYLSSKKEAELISDLLDWENEILMSGFNHIFYITADAKWQSLEEDLKGSLIYISTLEIGNMKETERMTIIDNQVKQVQSCFIEKWRRKE